jgi:dTDP-4-amino-4,6-dideoxygalactose transaminase
VWNQYVVRVPAGQAVQADGSPRDALRRHLTDRNIGSEIYYPVPLHQQVCFRELGLGSERLPHTEQAAAESLALPIFPGLTKGEQCAVVNAVAEWWSDAGPQSSLVPAPKSHEVRRAVSR